MPVLDLSILKNMLNIEGNEQDSYLSFILDASEKIAENRTGVLLTVGSVTEVKFGNDSRTIALNFYPIHDLTSVKERKIGDNTEVTITNNVDIFDKEKGVIYYEDFFKSECRYVIEYEAGFEEIPADLKYAIYQIAVRLYSLTDVQKTGAKRIVTPDGTIVYDDSVFSGDIGVILNKYSRTGI